MVKQPQSLPREWTVLLFLPWIVIMGGAAFFMVTLAPPAPPAPSADEGVSAPRFDVRLVTPAPLTHVRTEKGKSVAVKFAWQVVPAGPQSQLGEQTVFLDLSSDPNFTPATSTAVALPDPEATEITRSLAAHRYFWRVRVGTASVSETRELWVDEETAGGLSVHPLALSTPRDGQDFFEGDDDGAISFSWHGEDLTGRPGYNYFVELSRRADFGGKLISLKTVRPGLSSKQLKLAPAKYFWRVRLVDPAGVTVVKSNVFTFIFDESPTLLPPRTNIRLSPN